MDPLVKQFLTKMANTDFQGDLVYPNMNFQDPQSWGSRWAQDVQAYGHLRPGSAEYNAAMRAQGYTPQYMQGLTSLGQRALAQAQDPDVVRALASGQAPNFGQLTTGIDRAQALGGLSNAFTALLPSAQKGLIAGAKHLNANPFDLFGLRNAAASTAATGLADGLNIESQIMQGAQRQLDRNSPLVRQFMSNAATTYAGNKINDWTSGMGSFGRGLRGLGHFMLGMGSRLPGYETFSNKLVDWFGPDMSKYFGKRSSMALPAPYSHYSSVRISCGTEVLTPWIRR